MAVNTVAGEYITFTTLHTNYFNSKGAVIQTRTIQNSKDKAYSLISLQRNPFVHDFAYPSCTGYNKELGDLTISGEVFKQTVSRFILYIRTNEIAHIQFV